ncbi:hypothetical protein GGR55DRAFT_681817 [Xylaria sp. FL0064]|nr:hypothetical protein GGR55DRAFT_681817 [Xylaria sp. FL0064]
MARQILFCSELMISSVQSLKATIAWLRAHLRRAEEDAAAEEALRAVLALWDDNSDDDDDDNGPLPPQRAATGENLRELWLVVSGRARQGARAGERRRMSGPQMIAAAAQPPPAAAVEYSHSGRALQMAAALFGLRVACSASLFCSRNAAASDVITTRLANGSGNRRN